MKKSFVLLVSLTVFWSVASAADTVQAMSGSSFNSFFLAALAYLVMLWLEYAMYRLVIHKNTAIFAITILAATATATVTAIITVAIAIDAIAIVAAIIAIVAAGAIVFATVDDNNKLALGSTLIGSLAMIVAIILRILI